jgi:hypothetical protein
MSADYFNDTCRQRDTSLGRIRQSDSASATRVRCVPAPGSHLNTEHNLCDLQFQSSNGWGVNDYAGCGHRRHQRVLNEPGGEIADA